jgi:hypothetical protein
VGYHLVKVLVSDRRVVVFGAGENCVYVEGFDAATGKNLFRMSTAY